MMKRFAICMVMILWGGMLRAAPEINVQASAEAETIQEAIQIDSIDEQIEKQKLLLSQIDEVIRKSKLQLRRKSEAYYQVQLKSSHGPLYVWQNVDESGSRRKEIALKMMGLALREGVKELDVLENRRLEAQAELEWLNIQKEEILNTELLAASKSSTVSKKFTCRVLPVSADQKIELSQGFGPQKDAETGIQWNSLGWWISAIQSEVKACESGRVVFVGDISGRGRVVMLDHGAGHLTVYANLNPDSAKLLKKGQRVEAGEVLGFSRDRVYFEFRDQGTASDPKNILRPDLLSRLSL
jgi:murein DD-endopeptidase MepM/ murein hydrolase activator NlpD